MEVGKLRLNRPGGGSGRQGLLQGGAVALAPLAALFGGGLPGWLRLGRLLQYLLVGLGLSGLGGGLVGRIPLAAALLGGGAAAFWLRVGLPNLLPSLLGTFSILFANAIAAFATAYALMQNNFQLLPIRISEQFVGDVVQRKEFGSALAVVLMLMMVATIAANGVILKKRGGRG